MRRKFTRSPISASESPLNKEYSEGDFLVYAIDNSGFRPVVYYLGSFKDHRTAIDYAGEQIELYHEFFKYKCVQVEDEESVRRSHGGLHPTLTYHAYLEAIKEKTNHANKSQTGNQSSATVDSPYIYYGVYTACIHDEDDVEEVERIENFDKIGEARQFIEEHMEEYLDDEINGMQIVAMPSNEDDEDCQEFFEYDCDYEMYEVIETHQAK